MTELVQQLVDGIGRGSIYALPALGSAVIFGVLHLVNFAHGELITVSAYVRHALFTLGLLIVGGRNSVTGALLGVVVMTIGLEGMRDVAGPDVNAAALDWLLRDGLTGIFLGGAMLGFMIFRSSGLLNDWELDAWLLGSLRRRRAPGSDDPRPAPESPPPQANSLATSDGTVDFVGEDRERR